MAWHLYFVPTITDAGDPDIRWPKYMQAFTGPNRWAAMDYGFQPVMLVALDASDAEDAALQLNADVTRVPDNLDQQVGAVALSIIQNALETRHLPAGWVTAGITYREVLRTIGGFFAFLQRYSTVANSTALVFGGSVNLDTRVNQLPVAVRNNLSATATSLGLNASGITGTTILRTVLKNIADQWGQREIALGPVVRI